MKKILNALIAKLSGHKMFLRNFLFLFLIMTIIFSSFSLYVYHHSRQILEEEFIAVGQQDIDNLSSYLDNCIMDIRYVISTLVINDLVQMFCSSPTPDLFIEGYSRRMQDQIKAFQNGNQAIEAIYLYSESTHMLYTATQQIQFDSFTDRSWMEYLNPDSYGFSIFPYAMNDIYPYVISVVKQFNVNGHEAAIAVFVNLSRLALISELNQSQYQELYLISDDNEVIFRYNQQEITEPLSVSKSLDYYDSGVMQKAILDSNDFDPFTFIQVHSADYGWSYVLITHLQEYTNRLSSSRALLLSISFVIIIAMILIAMLFSLRSIKPIRTLLTFLDHPDSQIDNPAYDKEITYIAGRITQYIQTNKQLATELNKRLNLLNETQLQALQSQINPHFLLNTLNMIHILETDYLGYEHIVPQMTLNLGELLRYALEPAEMVTLSVELTYTDRYLSILNQRYGETLVVNRQIDPRSLSAKVPRLFLQPVIENAVFHGFSKMHDSECRLSIICNICEKETKEGKQDFIILTIADNGIGMKESTLKMLREVLEEKKTPSGKSIGLRNVMQRMRLIYSNQPQITIESRPNEGTQFTLTFPFIR